MSEQRGRIVEALPLDRVRELLAQAGQIAHNNSPTGTLLPHNETRRRVAGHSRDASAWRRTTWNQRNRKRQ